jgi:hypothetical protein
MGAIMPWIDYVMMRKQLERLKAHAERSARQGVTAAAASVR